VITDPTIFTPITASIAESGARCTRCPISGAAPAGGRVAGCEDRIVTHAPDDLLTVQEIATTIASELGRVRLFVAIDGGDGSGKTTFATGLAEAVRDAGRECTIIHADDFMRVRSERHRRGRMSPVGYLDDSYDYDALERNVLQPLSSSGDGWFRSGAIDRIRDAATEVPTRYSAPGTVVIVEGLFLLRDELFAWWDFSVFLGVPVEVALRRKEMRDGVVLNDSEPLTRRYVEGQRIYRERYNPLDRATWVLGPR
jgi:uridine kinase